MAWVGLLTNKIKIRVSIRKPSISSSVCCLRNQVFFSERASKFLTTFFYNFLSLHWVVLHDITTQFTIIHFSLKIIRSNHLLEFFSCLNNFIRIFGVSNQYDIVFCLHSFFPRRMNITMLFSQNICELYLDIN